MRRLKKRVRTATTAGRLGTLVLLLAGPGAAQAQLSVPAGAALQLPDDAALGLACVDLSVGGSLALQASQVDQAASIAIGGGLLDGGSGTIRLSGDWRNSGSFVPGTSTVIFGDGCTSGPMQLSGSTDFHNLSLTSASGRSVLLPAGSRISVNGTLTLQGAPGQPLSLASAGPGPAVVSLAPGAQVNRSNTLVSPQVQLGAPAAEPTAVPTLGEGALAALAALLAVLGWRRRGRTD